MSSLKTVVPLSDYTKEMGRSFKLCNRPFEASVQLVIGGEEGRGKRQTIALLIGLSRHFHYAEGTFHVCCPSRMIQLYLISSSFVSAIENPFSESLSSIQDREERTPEERPDRLIQSRANVYDCSLSEKNVHICTIVHVSYGSFEMNSACGDA